MTIQFNQTNISNGVKLFQKTIKVSYGPVVVHGIEINPKYYVSKGSAIVPVVADAPNTAEKMEQIAAAFRRIKNVGLNGIRGEETNDTVFIISRKKETQNKWIPLTENGKTIFAADAIEFTILTKLVKEQRLWMLRCRQAEIASRMNTEKHQRFEVSPAKDKLESLIVTQLSNQNRLHYSIPKNAAPSKKNRNGAIAVNPSLLPIGYTNSFATLPELCDRESAIAGINAGYFLNMPEELDSVHGVMNDPVGLLMFDGKILVPPTFTRSTLLINHKGNVFIRPISMQDIEIRFGKISIPQSHKDLTIYTRVDGTKTPNNKKCIDVVIVNQEVVEINEMPPTVTPQNGFVVSLYKGSNVYAQIINAIEHNRSVQYNLKLPRAYGTILHAIAGGPQLITNGKSIPTNFFKRKIMSEDFNAMKWAPTRFTHTVSEPKSRAPRSAIGITKEHNLLFITIDDDRKIGLALSERYSFGATLGELAGIMADFGSVDALNFDGGGSTTLYSNGRIRNKPSDGFPRVISTAVIVK